MVCRAHTYLYIYTHIKHITRTSHGFGWRFHCGVEVTELSTNKQHLSLRVYVCEFVYMCVRARMFFSVTVCVPMCV